MHGIKDVKVLKKSNQFVNSILDRHDFKMGWKYFLSVTTNNTSFWTSSQTWKKIFTANKITNVRPQLNSLRFLGRREHNDPLGSWADPRQIWTWRSDLRPKFGRNHHQLYSRNKLQLKRINSLIKKHVNCNIVAYQQLCLKLHFSVRRTNQY